MLAIRDEATRANILAGIAGDLSAKQNRQNINKHLWRAYTSKRDTVLCYCWMRNLFAPPIFSQAALERVAQSVMDVCWKWRWG